MTGVRQGQLFGFVEAGDVDSLRETLSSANEDERKQDLSAKSADGITLVHAAAFHGALQCLREIVERHGEDSLGKKKIPCTNSFCHMHIHAGYDLFSVLV